MLSRVYNLLSNGNLNALPAEQIDKIHLENPTSIMGKTWKFTKLRLWYTAFIGISAVDLITSALLTVRYLGGSIVRSDTEQKTRLKNLEKYATLTGKNALVIVTLPLSSLVYVGLANPGTVTDRFLEETPKKGVHAGGNLYHAEDAELVKPKSVKELQNIVKNAAKEGKKIIPVGAGRSQGKQFLPVNKDDIVIDLENLHRIEIHSKSKYAIVDAGVRWEDLQKEADKFCLAIQVMQASNVFSVGGSIGTNIHGWKHTMGTLSNTILSMDIINAKGELETLTPEDDLFHFILGGLGLVGIVVRAKLQLTDNELLLERSKEVAIQDYAKYFYENVLSNENIRMHLFRLSLDPSKLLLQGISVDYVLQEDSEPCTTPELAKERIHGKREERIKLDAAREFDILRKQYWDGEVERLLKNDSLPQTTNAIMQPPICAMFTASQHKTEWLQEYFLPAEQLANYLEYLSKLLMDNKVVLFNASVRFIKKDVHPNRKVSPMSYAHDEDRFAIVICWHQSLEELDLRRAEKWLREAQYQVVEMGGTYYLPYQHVSSPEVFDKAYPHVNEFLAIKKQVDPNNLFVSGFYQKYMTPRPQHKSHIRAIMKNENNKNDFSGFLSVVLQRVDADKLYPLIEDIFKYRDSEEEVYQELCKRLPEIMPNTFNSLSRILNSLSTIKTDLGAQAKYLLPEVKKINGLVEIGYPGRFVGGFKQNFEVEGKIVVVLEQLSMTDYIQTGFPSPYHEFQKLDYDKPNLANLADESADVITCYVGLHHFPEEELEIFLEDIRRVLRPGGNFLLVDHDVENKKSLHYAHGAHTIFNAVNGISTKDELKERRNFRPISYWQKHLVNHGLAMSESDETVPLIRENDPSRNRMVCFQKPGLVKEMIAAEEFDNGQSLSQFSLLSKKKFSNEEIIGSDEEIKFKI